MKAQINVVVYTRHKQDCSKKHLGERHTHCECPKWLRHFDSTAKKQVRQPASTRSWAEATERAKTLERNLRSGNTSSFQQEPTLQEAFDTYLLEKTTSNYSYSRLANIKSQLSRLVQFMHERSKSYACQLTPTDLIEYKASWGATDRLDMDQRADYKPSHICLNRIEQQPK
jgi:hypothetical protein